MTVRVLFFGATGDIAGVRFLDLQPAENADPASVLKEMVTRFPGLASHNLHLSLNQEYAIGDETIRDGDELSIFTAVSGG